MRTIATLCRLYLLENLRRQLHLITLFLGLVLILLPTVVNSFGMEHFERVNKDFGLTLIGFFAVFMALFLGSTAIPGDLERRTHFAILSKPMPRSHYLLGKYLGIVSLMSVSLLFLGLCMLGTLPAIGIAADYGILLVAAYDALAASVLAAVCLVFSIRFSPVAAAVWSCAVYILGGLPQVFIEFFFKEGFAAPVRGAVVKGLKAVLPHFDVFQFKDAIVHGDPISVAYLGAVLLYGLLWIGLLLLVADWLFDRRDV